jgi:hypothetical protein
LRRWVDLSQSAVAMPSQRVVLPLKRLLPYRWFETVVGAAMGA